MWHTLFLSTYDSPSLNYVCHGQPLTATTEEFSYSFFTKGSFVSVIKDAVMNIKFVLYASFDFVNDLLVTCWWCMDNVGRVAKVLCWRHSKWTFSFCRGPFYWESFDKSALEIGYIQAGHVWVGRFIPQQIIIVVVILFLTEYNNTIQCAWLSILITRGLTRWTVFEVRAIFWRHILIFVLLLPTFMDCIWRFYYECYGRYFSVCKTPCDFYLWVFILTLCLRRCQTRCQGSA